MPDFIKQRDVPEGMVARCPWGQPLKRWDDAMLARGLDECVSTPSSPVLAAKIAAEIRRRA